MIGLNQPHLAYMRSEGSGETVCMVVAFSVYPYIEDFSKFHIYFCSVVRAMNLYQYNQSLISSQGA